MTKPIENTEELISKNASKFTQSNQEKGQGMLSGGLTAHKDFEDHGNWQSMR
jgi:hypothetical protein